MHIKKQTPQLPDDVVAGILILIVLALTMGVLACAL